MNPTEDAKVAEANEVIELLGGTTKTAVLCEISPQAVSQWRENGIPKAQRKFLRAERPDIFKRIDQQRSHPESQPQ